MKKLLSLLIIMLISFASFGQNELFTTKLMPYFDWGGKRNMGISKPTEYGSTSKKYPLLIFLHGNGQAGNDLNLIYNSASAGGPPYLIMHNAWPNSFTNPADGLPYKFIVAAPQSNSWSVSGVSLNIIIKALVDSLRVDTDMIYITGLSAGADGITQFILKDGGFTPFYKVAAILPMADAHDAVSQTAINTSIADDMFKKAWGFGDTVTDIHGIKTKGMMQYINNNTPGMARFTGNRFGHDGWMTYYVTSYNETISGTAMNMYEWMLTNKRTSVGNPAPVVSINGGSPKTVTLPTSSISITATATAGAGSIIGHLWTRISGPNTPGVSGNTTATVNIGGTGTALINGTYVYQDQVTQTDAQTAAVQVTINVNNSAPPDANPGSDQSVANQTSFSLDGTGSTAASGRTITNYLWSKVSGTGGTISTPTASTTTVTGVTNGTYVYKLRVTQSDGQLDSANVTIVNTTSNPIANAGPDQNITLPASTVTLAGNGIAGTGSITAYSWVKQSGGAATITSASSATTTVTGLVSGTYVFRLTVTQTGGATATDDITVTVNAASSCNLLAPVSYTLAPTSPNEIYITNASGRPWKGGDTLKIPAGTYSVIEIDSFGGDPCRDIIIMNSGGLVNVTGSIRLQKDVHHVKITGSGFAGLTNGFKCVSFAFNRVNHFLMERIEVGPNPGGVGIYGKQDPYEGQLWTQYPSYTMRKVTIQDCYVHDVAGEGMYIGHTYPGGDPDHSFLIPPRMDSVTIRRNTVINSGWDGIQLSNARDGCEISNNIVDGFGLIDYNAQRAGIISGGNTNTQIFGNTITNGYGNGIQFFGYGVMECYNNIITNVGNTTKTSGGEESIYGTAAANTVETNPNMSLTIRNNQFNQPKTRGAIRFNDTVKQDSIRLLNNNFCFAVTPPTNWKSLYFFIPKLKSDSVNNNLSCETTPNQPPSANAGNDQTIDLPTNSVNLSGSGIDPDGTIATYAWVKLTGAAATIVRNDSSYTSVTGLVTEGVYTFKLTVTDNSGSTATDTIQITVNPAAPIPTPIANAGPDQTITLPTSAITLNATGTTGAATRFRWKRISGTGGTIVDTTASITPVTGLTAGTYQFQLSVSHEGGESTLDTIDVVVNPLNALVSAFGGQPNAVIAKQTISFITAGINSTNTSIIYEVGNPLKSYIPGRAINAITGFTKGKGYWIVAKTNISMPGILYPPID